MTLRAEPNLSSRTATDAWRMHLVNLVRWLLGLDYLVNGVNWYFKIITPYPSRSDFIAFEPPHDIVGAMIDNGVLFPLAKATEVITGLALLTDLFVPLALVLAMTVTVPVFVVDALRPHPHLRAVLMGTGALTMNLFLLGAYFNHYRALLVGRGTAGLDPAVVRPVAAESVTRRFAVLLRPLLLPLGLLGALMGVTMVIWLGVMVVQYVQHPLPISAIHPLTPR